MRIKILFCGGGTMGHVIPALATAERVPDLCPEAEILFIGRENGKENKAILNKGYRLKTVYIKGFSRKNLISNIKLPYIIYKARHECEKIIKEYNPNIIFATGGYVCMPVLSVAKKLKIPYIIHESNSTPGLVTRLYSGKSSLVLLGFDNKKFKAKQIKVTGNPVLKSFDMITREAARKKLKLNKDDILILSVGGSGGAKRINEIAISLMNNYNNNTEKIKHIHSAGYSYYSYLTKNNPKLINTENTRIVPFIENMPIYLKASDIVITRCGSATLAEIEKCKCTPILIPSPNVASNHQLKNAKEYLKNNVGFLIEEKDVTQSKLIELIEKIIKNKNSSENKNNTEKEDAAYIAAESIINMMRQLD